MGSIRQEYLIDTSVFIGREGGRDLREIPQDAPHLVSSITMGELRTGVYAAPAGQVRERRWATYCEVARNYEVVVVDSTTATTWAEYEMRRRYDGLPVGERDTWIAATAATHGLVLITQDRGFEWYEDLDLLVV